ncbi:MAG: delta-lactam-biosynthetic de-N-acetylase [Clostridia bacterium]
MSVRKEKSIFYLASVLIIAAFTFSIVSYTQKQDIIATSGSVIESKSNQKIEWGIKRNDNHEQPDLGSKNRRIIDENNGIAMGSKEYKYVYLTFDEGYEAGYTEKILEVLKQNEVKATFFITAHYVNTQPDLVRKMIEEGHTIGNHTVNHKSMPSLTTEQIKKEVMDLHTSIYNQFGYEMKYIRPPKGEYSEKSVAYCNTLGYTTVMWSFAYDDWNENAQRGEAYAKQKILDNVHNGAVILLHGNSKDNTNVLDACIKEIKNEGYTFRSLDDFVR